MRQNTTACGKQAARAEDFRPRESYSSEHQYTTFPPENQDLSRLLDQSIRLEEREQRAARRHLRLARLHRLVRASLEDLARLRGGL
jgi:hypothetical protein